MKRFLTSNVGKNWNKVHSKLCGQLNKKTVSGLHVFNHLYDFVFEKTFTDGNRVFYQNMFGTMEELLSFEKWPRFYVHHKTGQLMKAKMYTRKK